MAAARSTRGRRMRSRIVRAVSSFQEMCAAPNDTPSTMAIARSKARRAMGRINATASVTETNGGHTLAAVVSSSSIPIRRPRRLHSLRLALRELVHTRVLRVVHEVVDGVEAGVGCARAGVAADGAVECGGLLRRRVGDV